MLGLISKVVALAALASAHTVITYPGWRGNNLHTNGTDPTDCPDCLGINYYENGTSYFPYGMQWMYPCGGLPQAANRTYWPVSGGAIAVQPGWFAGHSKAFIYINIGIQEEGQLAPLNYSHNVVPGFEITGPSDQEYGGQFCLPQISMPANVSLQVGKNITIQVVEQAQHGAALYSCVDVTLAEDGSDQVENVNQDNCYNTSDIGFGLIYTTAANRVNAAGALKSPSGLLLLGSMLIVSAFATVM